MEKTILNSKSLARIGAIQVIYEYHIRSRNLTSLANNIEKISKEVTNFFHFKMIKREFGIDGIVESKIHVPFFRELVLQTANHNEETQVIISRYLQDNWSIDRLGTVLLAILEVGICELKYFSDITYQISINEYTNIAAEMLSSIAEVNFVNGVLDRFRLEINNR